MGPEELRELAEGNKHDCRQIDEGCPEIWPELEAAADAWASDRRRLAEARPFLEDAAKETGWPEWAAAAQEWLRTP